MSSDPASAWRAAHHRALASVALRSGGHKLSSDISYGIWCTWRKAGRR